MRKVMAVVLLTTLFCLGLFDGDLAFGDMPGFCTPVPCGCTQVPAGCCWGSNENGWCMNGNQTCTGYQNFDCSGTLYGGTCNRPTGCPGGNSGVPCALTTNACSANK